MMRSPARATRVIANTEAAPVKLATYNVNGINGRLDVLLQWLTEAQPDVVCLQELKAPEDKFPRREIERAGYGAIWHGQKSWNGVAILARDQEPRETRRGLPGDPDDSHSRYIEAAIDGIVVGCLYLPNGNPAPGPKFDYKLRWFERLHSYAAELFELDVPVALVGDFNVMPTDLDVYKPERWRDDALFRPEVRAAYAELIAMGWTDAIRLLHPEERIYTFWKYFRNAFVRDAGLELTIFCSVHHCGNDCRPVAWTSSRVDGSTPATTRRFGLNWTTDSISQGHIGAVVSRRATLSDVRWRNIGVTVCPLNKNSMPRSSRIAWRR